VSIKFADSVIVKLLCGHAAYESGNWKEAVAEYQRAREIEPWCMEGMVCAFHIVLMAQDLYSASLWHLGKTAELSYLGQTLVETNKLHGNSWFVYLFTYPTGSLSETVFH
jgi:hypothetical protein